ncbi:2-nitropropane dioxygenase [Achromobacter sp. HZ01]|jgi:nitronate monooxygenase|uniref:2-nitropropane dioxygenase n=1 Tax=Achromobacter pulmonis TaxID=1389932 RepID=A0A2N8KNQ7_9BURK|nr:MULTISPECIES: nitronate monooxygenase family protein [Achromobacter]MBO9331016.1 nitronate monooxygenase [Achromobacter xylosoxidans]PND35086.1 2-nitropropane dioxygenase [Achromobacter pulmonis]RAP65526.1 2-nitropropane dioxygenase [Achromobacter sp. HZ01]
MTWFKSLTLAGRELLPIVQGGMGVGISAHRLAGAVASQNAMGTIASIDLRHHHPDLLEKTERCHDRDLIDSANLEALHREIRAALDTAQGRGLVAVNVMKAVRGHPALVRQACESGAQAIVMGAGLPLDLPEMTADFPKVALVPILSEARGVAAVLKKWIKKGRLADAVVIEHPGHAGGHLGAARLEDVHDERFDFKRVLADCHKLFQELALGKDAPKLIVAGGVGSHDQVRHWLGHGADGVQVGTAFAVTIEGDAHENFKRVLIDADPDQLKEFTSVAGLPARAVATPWLTRYLRQEKTLQENTRCDARRCSQRMDCLTQCGLRDGLSRFGQFCIDLKLAAAMRGEVSRGLFFRGASKLPFGNAMRSVRELMDYLLHGQMPANA